jgi:hypothetical protein
MPDISQAWARLGLEAGASGKEVRRAYARALKMLDQETEIAAFQALREAYEVAIGSRLGSKSEEPAPVTEDEAQEAFEWMVAAVSVISGGRRIADETIWVDDLREQLAEQQPAGIDAGWRLESAIGRLLLEGWRPGHEALLLAATDHFGWAELGSWPHAQIADAWFERWLLHRQPEALRAPLVRVIRDLRQLHEPEIGRLRRDHGYFEHLATYYANLAPVVVDMQMLERWRQLAKPLGAAPEVSWTAIGKGHEPSRAWEITRTLLMLIVVLLWISFNVIRMFNNA